MKVYVVLGMIWDTFWAKTPYVFTKKEYAEKYISDVLEKSESEEVRNLQYDIHECEVIQ